MKKLAFASLLMTTSLLLSRLIGFIRDAIIASEFGAGVETDAYFAAFTLPDFLNYLVAGGAFSLTFIPIFTMFLVKKEEEKGWHLYSIIISVMSVFLLIFIVVLEILAPIIIPKLFPGFSPEIIDRTVLFTRIVLPAQFFFYNGGIIAAILMAKKRFLAPALAPLIYNISIIFFGLLFSSFGMIGFAIGALIGSILGPFGIQYFMLRKEIHFKFKFLPKDKEFLRFLKISIPIMAGLLLVTLDDWLSKRYGSFLEEGTISWVNNARRLVLVPIGLFAQANAQAILPFLSEQFAKGDHEAFQKLLKRAFSLVLFVTSFAASWFILFSTEIIQMIYQRGAFTITDTLNTADIFLYFAIGIPFWSGIIILSRVYYAMQHTVTPMVVGAIMSLLSLPLFYLLSAPEQMGGAGLSLTISIIKSCYFLLLLFLLKRIYHQIKIKELIIPTIQNMIFFTATLLPLIFIKSYFSQNWFLIFMVGSTAQLIITLTLAKLFKIEAFIFFYEQYLKRYMGKLFRKIGIKI